jgi:hypothetical protein
VMRDADDMENEAEGIREDDYQEERARRRAALGPEFEEEDGDLPLCVSCEHAEGVIETARGMVCGSCWADQADADFDRLNEIRNGDRL